jgi:hypothetical protein
MLKVMEMDFPCVFKAYNELSEILKALNPSLVVIDGQLHTGKTNLARYLGWRNRMSVIELDCFIRMNDGVIEHDMNSLYTIIFNGKKGCKSMIIEGFNSYGILLDLNFEPDFVVLMEADLRLKTNNLADCDHDTFYEINTTRVNFGLSRNSEKLHPKIKSVANFRLQGFAN